jgi:hypothetical protein
MRHVPSDVVANVKITAEWLVVAAAVFIYLTYKTQWHSINS